MTESATTVVRGEAGLEQPVMQMMQRTAEALGRTGRDNTGISDGGNLSWAALSKPAYPPPGISHDCAAARFPAIRRPKPAAARLRHRRPRPEPAPYERLDRLRARRRGADQLRRVLGPRVCRSRYADAAADADTHADARWWGGGWGWHSRRHARKHPCHGSGGAARVPRRYSRRQSLRAEHRRPRSRQPRRLRDVRPVSRAPARRARGSA